MAAQTRLSAKGQVVIPKDVRDALGLKPGQALDVVQANGGIWLRPATAQKSGATFEEISDRIQARMAKYRRAPLTIEEMNEAVEAGWREAGLKSDCRAR